MSLRTVITQQVVRFLKEQEQRFRLKHDKSVDLDRYQYRVLLLTSRIRIVRDDLVELKDIFKKVPQIHCKFGMSGSFQENVIAVYCYMRRGFLMGKENIPPCLDRFFRRIYLLPMQQSDLRNFNLQETRTRSNRTTHGTDDITERQSLSL